MARRDGAGSLARRAPLGVVAQLAAQDAEQELLGSQRVSWRRGNGY